MILNSGRHTQPDPQSCRVSSLEGRREGAQKQTTHQETKTKLSSATKRSTANVNTEKSIPPAMSQRNQHLTHAMLRKPATTTQTIPQHGALAKIGNMQAGLETLQSATVFPGIAIPLHLQHCFLLKLRHFSQKKVTAAFFFSNALIAFARSLCKCLLAVLISAKEARRIKLQVVVVPSRIMSYH